MYRTNKATAKKLFMDGEEVILVPSMCGPLSMFAIRIKKQPYQTLLDFERLINEFSYYNCNNETGRRVHYYTNPFGI